ncbi:Asp-tRNA(Asn)/Glu-tRNA(Gln) amidotransferase subunit GatB [Candidatus Microgenomates bacterium]|nr:Asp-tRNA(Asn)/Glu-tRNA(Gln) amidotransferase subunit GatB [Candidatus Microgenomates bacterium]
MKYIPIIGLEIHVELKTKSKMFCGCEADYFGKKPNTHCCPVCLGLPGALPVPNKKAIEWTVMTGLALDCQIPLFSKFDRKNYFYPDLPKGYQISQYDSPFCKNGELNIKYQISKNIKEKIRKIKIRRVHLEEDTGKLIHAIVDGKKCTLIDFNRSGVPLMEVVTEPDIRSGEEAKIFLQKLQQLLRYLGVSDCDMEKGSMRCEPNVSLRDVRGSRFEVRGKKMKLPDYKVEVKNLNSFKFVEKAINYEIKRQAELLEAGKKIKQETRGWDEDKQKTFSQRSKEEAADYRYFPEPDIPPIRWRKEDIKILRNSLSELPEAKSKRFLKEYKLSEYDIRILTADRMTADYFEQAVRASKAVNNKTIANWIINKRVDIEKTLPAELIKIILEKHAPSTISKEELEKIIKQVLVDNAGTVNDYKKGKTQASMYLIGQVMSRTKGQADAKMAEEILKSKIDSETSSE